MKETILSSALPLFFRMGIRKMSMQSLSDTLGVSTKTIYKYYTTKEKLLESALKHHNQLQFVEFEKIILKKGVAIQLYEIWKKGIELEYAINRDFYKELHKYYPTLAKKMDTINAKLIWGRLIDFVEAGKQAGELIPEIQPVLFLESLAQLYLSITRFGKFDKMQHSVDGILQNSILPIIRGACSSKSIKQFDHYIHTINKN